MKVQSGLVDSVVQNEEPFLPGSYFHSILFTYLVVVFDGPIFEATVKDGRTQIEEIDRGLIRAAWNPKRLDGNRLYHSIEVVRPRFFKKYLSLLQDDIKTIKNRMIGNQDLEEYLSSRDRPA